MNRLIVSVVLGTSGYAAYSFHSEKKLDENIGVKSSSKIFLLLGPSGVGKDTLKYGARDKLQKNKDESVVFCQRVITRPLKEGDAEIHEVMEKEEFLKEKEKGTFGIDWEAYNFFYGIRNDLILNPLKNGKNVLLNISRNKIEEAQNKYESKGFNVVVLEISADPEIIKNRLKKRGRETEEQINQRIQRHLEQRKKVIEVSNKIVTIENNGTIEEGIEKFINVLKSN
eukprot:gene4819-8405_t